MAKKVELSIMGPISQMRELLDGAELDGQKFMEGNSSAGTRVRGALQEIKVLIKIARDTVTTIKNERKGK